MLQSCIIALALLLPAALQAQTWEPVGNKSFTSLASAEDGALLLLRYPGDILRSTDSGGTWQEVYHGTAPLTSFRVEGKGQRVEGNALIAFGDSSTPVESSDSGRTWHLRVAPPPSSLLEKEGESRSLKAAATGFYPFPLGTNSVSFADSEWYAVGEPGLICVWDAGDRRWRELHRAPFSNAAGSQTAPPPGQPPPGPRLEKAGGNGIEGEPKIAFSSAAHGAIAIGNRIYFTNDSAVTWSETILPAGDGWPTAGGDARSTRISSFFLLSDTSAIIGMCDGHLYYHSQNAMLRFDSILNSTDSTAHPILRMGWKDKLDGDLFVLTDSLLYSVRSDLSSATPYALPLASGERAVAASFPDAYTGFLLTDSLRRFDTITRDGHDTTLLFDTCKVYRSLDGGATWSLALKNVPNLANMYIENTKIGFVCGANGLIMHTEDTGSHWARAWTLTKQNIHDVNFVNETTGYAVGDSGMVLFTQTSGRFWRPIPPEPLFTHPTITYAEVAFLGEHAAYVVSNDRCYKATIPQPLNFHSHWHFPERHTLSISERPNPSSGNVTFDIRSTSKEGSAPTLKICDVSGTTLSEVSGIGSVFSGEWSARTDLSFLSPGVYTAIVTLGGEQAMCKFLIER